MPILQRDAYTSPTVNSGSTLRPFVGIVFVGRKVDAWEYPEKASRRRADNARGYDFTGQDFPEWACTGEE